MSQLEAEPELLRLAPLLGTVLAVDWPDNEITDHMMGAVRADNTNRLLVRLLQGVARSAPLVLTLEDAHWLDSASWTLARLVARDVPAVLLALALRSLGDTPLAEYTQLLQTPAASRIRLDVLSSAEAVALVCQRLQVQSLPEAVAALVQEKAQGHPLFSEELALALRESGLIHIDKGACRLTSDERDLRALNLPDTVQGLVTSRIDRLTPAEQLALKVASVIGRVFTFPILYDIYPLEEDRPLLTKYLRTLEKLELTRQERPEPDLAFVFKHMVTQEVAYNLMLVAQRRQLHRAAAEWYEKTSAENLAPCYPLLAYHWGKTDVVDKAVDYLEKAGEQALRTHAHEEAVAFLSKALALAPDAEPLRRGCWERQLGEAYYAAGNLDQGLQHTQAALALLGFPVPAGRRRLLVSLGRSYLRQMLHRAWPSRYVGQEQDSRAAYLEATRAYERLAQIHYLNNAEVSCLHAAFRALNLAEAAEPSPELARCYANACAAFGLFARHRTAEAYARRALETAQLVEHLPSLTYVQEVIGIYHYGCGQWTKAQEDLERARETAERLADLRRWEGILFALVMMSCQRGDLIRGEELANQLYGSAQRRGIEQAQAWGLSGLLESLAPRDRADEAVRFQVGGVMGLLEALLDKNKDRGDLLVRGDKVLAYGLLSRAYWRRGQQELALKAADRAAEISAQGSPISHYLLAGYAGIAEVYLAAWETNLEETATRRQMATRARPICRALRRFARMHGVGEPRAWLYQGLYDQLAGAAGRARRRWHKSLAAAERLAMPYEQGLAHYELGRHAEPGEPERQKHLDRASELFAQCGAVYDLARVRLA
jgi:hypothetical protein